MTESETEPTDKERTLLRKWYAWTEYDAVKASIGSECIEMLRTKLALNESRLVQAEDRVRESDADLQDAVGALRLLVMAKAIKNAGNTGDAYQQAKSEGWKAAFRIVNEQETKERDAALSNEGPK